MIHFCFGNGNSRKGIDIEQYKKFRPQLVAKVIDYMENYDSYKAPMNTQLYNLKRSFFSGEALYKEVSNG